MCNVCVCVAELVMQRAIELASRVQMKVEVYYCHHTTKFESGISIGRYESGVCKRMLHMA